MSLREPTIRINIPFLRLVLSGGSQSNEKNNCSFVISLTINIEAVLVKSMGAQVSDAMSQFAQLPIQLPTLQAMNCGIRAKGANYVHSSGCSIILWPG